MRKAILTKKVFVLSLLVSIVISLTYVGYLQGKQKIEEGSFTVEIDFIGNSSSEIFNNSRVTLREALGQNHNIKVAINGYVKCIDDICSGSDYQWLYYVNGKRMNYGIDQYDVNKDDVIEFKFKTS